jgi:hypothetical protein
MLDGIEVDVIEVALKISVVPDGMLPIATLPKRVFSVPVARNINAGFRDGGCKSPFG